MTADRVRLWDTKRQNAYVKERDQALDRRQDEREGITVARELDVIWATLSPDQKRAMTYLVMSGARSCVGHCSDALLSSLVDRGFLIWPPGVRPVLTNDLVTSFLVPSAVWVALVKRLPSESNGISIDDLRQQFSDHFTPLVTSDITEDPFQPSRSNDRGG